MFRNTWFFQTPCKDYNVHNDKKDKESLGTLPWVKDLYIQGNSLAIQAPCNDAKKSFRDTMIKDI